jgi:hypothetical protein
MVCLRNIHMCINTLHEGDNDDDDDNDNNNNNNSVQFSGCVLTFSLNNTVAYYKTNTETKITHKTA